MNDNTEQRTVTVNAYTAEELRKHDTRAFERARYEYSELMWATHGNDLVDEYMRSRLEEEWPELRTLQLRWSLGHCQGDGVSFRPATLTDDMVRALGVEPVDGFEYMILDNELSRYTHEYTFEVDWSSDTYGDLADDTRRALDSATSTLTDALRYVCRQLARAGYAEVEWIESAEQFVEAADANEWLFDELGRLIG